ncbi:lysosomal alpha-mannosidase [Anabrus simplex]|uniref:lysosomal alpha-mannosidase n=1 Tax=Anabrus simplex TaxID=316456 RepID=UPI0035A291BC
MKVSAICLFVIVTTAVPVYNSSVFRRDDSSRIDDIRPLKSAKYSCGYAACPMVRMGMINVHLIPHTHDDVGWLKTVDQYYYGSQSKIQKAGVQYILDSVIKELIHDPEKRFVYVETAYFWKWWKEQQDTVRHLVKELVRSGQLEFIGGAWSMNDEAVTHYHSIIDQFTWGLRKLNDTFGECGRPRVGWQIDPFGHSREMASLFAQMGYDGLFFSRLDYQDKHQRIAQKTTEMIWEASANLGRSSDLFTSVLYNGYGPPPGFCFDVLCNDDPIIDDKRSPDYNAERKVTQFIRYAEVQAAAYSTNNIIMTMGEDFNYQDANMWFRNLDKIIRHVNSRQGNNSEVNVFYSTPSCYLKAVHDEGLTWTTKNDDFFPYASDAHSYWTGFYTSRPTIKYFERQGNNFLQVCKQLYALADLDSHMWANLNKMREAMGVMQHHDAVTGTEKQAVAKDYARLLSNGMEECRSTAETAINKLLHNRALTFNSPPHVSMTTCLLLNISQCQESEESSNFVVTLYNPLSRPVWRYVRLPVVGKHFIIQDPNGKTLPMQLVPIPEPVLNLPGRMSKATQELVFLAENLPPLGFRSFFVSRLSGSAAAEFEEEEKRKKVQQNQEKENSVGNEGLSMEFSESTGLPDVIVVGGRRIRLVQDFYFYEAFIGNNREALNRSSGAYIFRPKGMLPIQLASRAEVKEYKGNLVEEIHQQFSDWVSQVVRVYKGENHIEYEWLVGPIPVDDAVGKEVVSRFSSDLNTNGVFYTDSNGREMLQRRRNQRPTWRVKVSEPVAGNYYPVTSKIVLRDEVSKLEMAVLTDRAQGGTSLNDGQLELMVHRRLLHDDAFGVDEALNETQYGNGLIVRGRHYLILGPIAGNQGLSLAAQERELAQRKLLAPWMFITPANGFTLEEWSSAYNMEYYGLNVALPPNVQILTLEPWKGNSLLLRLEHIMEIKDDPTLSRPATVSLRKLFAAFTILSLRETTLGANQWLTDSTRLIWKADTNEVFESSHIKQKSKRLNFAEDLLSVTLNPMQIRTFIIEVKSCL